FKIYLPASQQSQKKLSEPQSTELPIGNGETIFIVDDEESIREITSATLEAYGYKVITANDGLEAVAIYAKNRQTIRVVLTDIMMPQMDGLAMIRALQRINPDVAIV